MGIFDKWKEFRANRLEKSIESNRRLIRKDKVNKDERAAAIEFFCDLGDADTSIPALLQRFDFSADNGIIDTREKERALRGIIEIGKVGIPIIQKHMLQTTRIAWPLKAISKILSEDEVIEILKSCLDFGDVSFDQAKIDKNYDLLCLLADYKLTGYANKIAHFLEDKDERVRYAATELLVQQDDKEVPSLLEMFASDQTEENRRLRKAVLEAFSINGWALGDPKTVLESNPTGFRVSKEGKVTKATSAQTVH